MENMLFRGFHAHENGLVVAQINGEYCTGDWVVRNSIIQLGKADSEGGRFVFMPKVGDNYLLYPTDDDLYYPIVPETVGLYIGLYDIKGRMIFEHDVVRVRMVGCDKCKECDECEFIGRVVFSEGRFAIEEYGEGGGTFVKFEYYDMEVLGHAFSGGWSEE